MFYDDGYGVQIGRMGYVPAHALGKERYING